MMVEDFKKHNIVPDVIDQAPAGQLQITFESKDRVQPGSELSMNQVKQQPKLEWDAENNALYTVSMIDPDSSNKLLWLVTNVPRNDINRGKTLVDYLPSEHERGQKGSTEFGTQKGGFEQQQGQRGGSGQQSERSGTEQHQRGTMDPQTAQRGYEQQSSLGQGQGQGVGGQQGLGSLQGQGAGSQQGLQGMHVGQGLGIQQEQGQQGQQGQGQRQGSQGPQGAHQGSQQGIQQSSQESYGAPQGFLQGLQGQQKTSERGFESQKGGREREHRIVCLVYKQPEELNITEQLSNRRENFKIQEFSSKHKLGKPIAGNFFLCKCDNTQSV